jgi:hypothetical protein
MSGRDCIGIAKTGSGKTLAFVLPMLRHIRDQAELRDGDGPIALIMAPTRELVQQIAKVGGWGYMPLVSDSLDTVGRDIAWRPRESLCSRSQRWVAGGTCPWFQTVLTQL